MCSTKKCCGSMGCPVNKIANILVIIGGLNWGLVGIGMLFNSMTSWNLVNMIFGSMPMIEAIVYVLVGISALIMVFGCRCKMCKDACASCDISCNTACNTSSNKEGETKV